MFGVAYRCLKGKKERGIVKETAVFMSLDMNKDPCQHSLNLIIHHTDQII